MISEVVEDSQIISRILDDHIKMLFEFQTMILKRDYICIQFIEILLYSDEPINKINNQTYKIWNMTRSMDLGRKSFVERVCRIAKGVHTKSVRKNWTTYIWFFGKFEHYLYMDFGLTTYIWVLDLKVGCI